MISLCKTCQGSGSVGARTCADCFGFGAAAALGGKFLYWGKRIDLFEISLDRARFFVRRSFFVFLSLIAVAGLGYFLWQTVLRAEVVSAPDPTLLAFWISLLAVMFIVGRVMRNQEQSKAVSRREFSREKITPALEVVPFADGKRQSRRERLDISQTFAPESQEALRRAFELADGAKQDVLPLHIIAALRSSKPVLILLGRLGIHPDRFSEPLDRLLAKQAVRDSFTRLSPATREVIFEAYAYAYAHRRPRVSPLSLFIAAVLAEAGVREVFFELGVDEEKLENAVAWIRINDALRERYRAFQRAARLRPKGAMNRAMTALATPLLDRLSSDLTAAAARGALPLLIDREREMNEIFRIFEGGRKSVILVGPPGVGKNALAQGLAERMVEEDVPSVLSDKRMVSLSVADVVSGATPAEAQERLLTVLGEVARAENIALVVPDVGGMVGVSIGEGIDLGEAFAAEIEKGYFLCIATATDAAYAKEIESHALGRALERVRVDEMDHRAAIQVLESVAGGIEYTQKVFFSYDALERAVKLADRYMRDRFLPEKAMELIQEAAQAVRSRRGERQLVTGEDVAAVVSEKTRVPVTTVTSDEAEKLLRLEEELHRRVIGQDEAVRAVAEALRRARAELRETKKPIANFLFLGPTGVGKTELAKTVAAVYFGSEEAMVRLDMSEYQDQASIYRLVGPPGETGGGILSEAVRKQPFTLLLLDELEKAHPDVLNVFLQVMDDGRLTDNAGRVVDFTNVIMIATTNAGT
ncbi:ATP-dependent Clp protease ATP-binding subunit, partial [Candidatus Uhrbacteria bacterium]|nr:ATP-dependent Clp protease ATP-binding subunit [Candidatus Uhrbacteria bacterium]